jgi:hypothetical protein
MDVLNVPFNHFIGISRSEVTGLLELDDRPSYLNHLGTVQAAAQLALAEAATGDHLIRLFPELVGAAMPVVRNVEAKFRNPLRGKVTSRTSTEENDVEAFRRSIATKGRAFIAVHADVVDSAGAVGLSSSFEWFIQKLGARHV